MDIRIQEMIEAYNLSVGQTFREGECINCGTIEGFKVRCGHPAIIYREAVIGSEKIKRSQNVAEMGGTKFKEIIKNIIK